MQNSRTYYGGAFLGEEDLKETNIKKIRQISIGEEIGCEVLELGYFIEYNGKMVQDPISVMLSLSAGMRPIRD